MSFESPSHFRVDHSYENEFALAASAEVVAVLTFGLLLTSIMPELPWAIVPTTQGLVPTANNSAYFPITNERFTLWNLSCSTKTMAYTYNEGLCNTRYQVVEAFSTLATLFAIAAVVFGVMPFSPVSPREPKVALTHSMLCHMAAGLFALISWATFYGGLINGVFQSPNPSIQYSGYASTFPQNVTVASGGIIAVSAWCTSFAAWLLSLSAMIKYDSSAAEQAIIDHKQKKEQRRKRKAEMIQRLGEGAARAARDGIPLELGDKLYLGGTIAAGTTTAIAWMNVSVTPYLLLSPLALPATAAAAIIINVIACTVGSIVLLIGLSDLVPRPKAAVGGFAVFAAASVLWICNFGMAMAYLKSAENSSLMSLEAAVGTIGMGFCIATTIVLYHPFKIWERDIAEIPRPAKIHSGRNGVAFVNTAAISCVFGLGLACAAVSIFSMSEQGFIGPTNSPTLPPNSTAMTKSPTPPSTCPNGLGAPCNFGPPSQRCCQAPYQCIETSYTQFTCQDLNSGNQFLGIRNSFSVAQAFLGIFIGSSLMSFIFAAISLTPNGVMDVKVALSVTFSFSLIGSICGVISFAVLQNLILSNGEGGMPIECGYLLGGFMAQGIASACAFGAWLPYHIPFSSIDSEIELAQRQLEIEQIRLETVKTIAERKRLEASLPIDNTYNQNHVALPEGEEEKVNNDPSIAQNADIAKV